MPEDSELNLRRYRSYLMLMAVGMAAISCALYEAATTGTIFAAARHHARFVSLHDDPVMFWGCVIIYLIAGASCLISFFWKGFQLWRGTVRPR
jgi:hypothetical protein